MAWEIRQFNDMSCLSSRIRGVLRASATVALLACACISASAQQLPNGITPEQIIQAQQARGAAVTSERTVPPQVTPQITIVEPSAPPAERAAPSNLEKILSGRAGLQLKQFGYDQLGIGRAVNLPQMGAVQDSYVLGPGDELVVSLRGQENSEYRVTVDRDGRVVLPRLLPVSASGRSLGDFRKDLLNAVHRSYVETDAFITIGRMRQISVLVSGEVGSPGVRTLTGLATAADAIMVSGGVSKSGSLRNIKVLRGGKELTVDLYSILTSGVRSKPFALTEGDKIIVPPIGATIAVAGAARRSGIYELPPGQTSTSVREALALASGTAVPGAYSISLLKLLPDGKRQFIDVTGASNMRLHDGELIVIKTAVDISVNQVQLEGAVRSPGSFAIGKYQKLHNILPSADVLSPGAYVLFGYIDRINSATLQRMAIPFSPLRVIQGKEDLALQSDDTVHILTIAEIRELMAMLVPKQDLGRNSRLGDRGRRSDSQSLSASGRRTRDASMGSQDDSMAGSRDAAGRDASMGAEDAATGAGDNATGSRDRDDVSSASSQQSAASGNQERNGGDVAAALAAAGTNASTADADGRTPHRATFLEQHGISAAESAFIAKILGDYRVSVVGAVRNPGWYLVAPGTNLADVMVVVGGLTYDADMQEFELTSTEFENSLGISRTIRSTHPATDTEFASILMHPYDRVEFRHVYSDKEVGSVRVEGEVRYAGEFNIIRGERLSSVLSRAGGATEVGYPAGAVFIRRSIAKSELAENQLILNDMRSQLLSYLTKGGRNKETPMAADSIAAVQGLIQQMADMPTVGRMPVIADLNILREHPEMDTLLEPGDRIVIPKIPVTVLVMGEVVRPGAQRWESSSSPDTFIDKAGGTTMTADTSRIIVVLPDGSVRTSDNSWLSFGFGRKIPAGSTIYVPRKLDVYPVYEMIVDSLQIFSQLATTAAALAVLNK